MRGPWPRSLFSRLVAVLAVGLVVAQGLSAWINWAERDRLLLQAAGWQPAQRVADIVRLLDSMDGAERQRIVQILSAPPQIVTLDRAPLPASGGPPPGMHVSMFTAMLRATLGADHALRVVAAAGPTPAAPGAPGALRIPGAAGPGGMDRSHHEAMMRGAMMDGRGRMFGPGGVLLVTQVQLRDGAWVTFDSRLPREAAGLPARLLLTLGSLLAVVLLLSLIAVRWISRPLQTLARAAEALGKNLH